MGKQSTRSLIGHLPLVLLATFLVVVAPLLVVVLLRTSGVVTSVWVGAGIGVVLSFAASYAGATYWKTKIHSHDLLFNELMLWGWAQRWRSERRLSAATDLLGLTTGKPKAVIDGHLSNEEKASLLTQLTSSLEARDPYTHGHSRRVARHAANIAKRMGLSRDDVAKIRAAGAMHDVGKIETPIEVLHKQGKLTDEEFAIVKEHPVTGAVMVATLQDAELTAMIRHHHERLDGTGYPDGLAGDAIPVGARILAVADTFDAITSTRPYRHAHAHKKALNILTAEAGTQLDPDAVRAFCACYSGRRPLAYWTIIANARPRLAAVLGGGLGSAKAAGASVIAGAATAAAVGGLAVAPLVDAPAARSDRAAAASTKSSSKPASDRPRSGTAGPSPGARRERATGNSPRSLRSAPAPNRTPAVYAPKQAVSTLPVATVPAQGNGKSAPSAPAPGNGGGGPDTTKGEGPAKPDKGSGPKGEAKDNGDKGKGPGPGKGNELALGNGKGNGNGKGQGNGPGEPGLSDTGEDFAPAAGRDPAPAPAPDPPAPGEDDGESPGGGSPPATPPGPNPDFVPGGPPPPGS